jgi:hypothetical protein
MVASTRLARGGPSAEFLSCEPFVLARLTSLKLRGLIRVDADLGAVAHALSTLSFALAFNDQMLFRRTSQSLRRVVSVVAETFSLGLAVGKEDSAQPECPSADQS